MRVSAVTAHMPPTRGIVSGFIAAVLAGCATLTWHAAAAGGDPASSDPATTRLARIEDSWRQRAGVPGVVVAVRGPGGLRWERASGSALRGPGYPALDARARFRAGSVTKTFVAVVALQLVQEGRLRLDDPLAQYIPAFPRADQITVVDLLAHTSGVPDYEAVDERHGAKLLADRDRRWSADELTTLAAAVRPDFAPGEAYAYSNTGYLLVGQVIEAVTGRGWAEEIRRRILDPLALADTYIAASEGGPAVIPGYFDADNDGDEENVEKGRAWTSLETSEGAAGAIVSTAGDLVAFGDALFRGRLLDPAMLEQMVADRPYHPLTGNYGLGVQILRPDYRTLVWGHGGALPGFRATLWHVPDRDVTVAVLANSSRANTADLAELTFRTLL